jgi:hypothetical protein
VDSVSKSIIFTLASQFFKLSVRLHKNHGSFDRAFDDTVSTPQLMKEVPINDKTGGTKQNFLIEDC